MLASLRNRLDSWPLIGLFGALYLASQLAIASITHELGSDFLVVQTTLSAAHVRGLFERWAAAGLLETYAAHYRFDMIHPLWYAMALATMLAKGFNDNHVPASRNALLLLPFFAGACDVLENLVHLSFLQDLNNITEARVWLGNGAALIKWALAAALLGTVCVLTVKARLRRGPRDPS